MKTLFINGCFDILQPGHFNLLAHGRYLAGNNGKVIVAIDEDEKIMASKGLRRPIFNVHERAKSLLCLKIADKPIVDEIHFFHTDHHLMNIIKRINPDIILKGSDWQYRYVVGSEYSTVVFFERLDDYSTTDIVTRVLEKHNVK